MQFTTKIGLVDIPNAEVLAAARDIGGDGEAIVDLTRENQSLKRKVEELEKAQLGAEMAMTEVGIPSHFEDGNDSDDLDFNERIRILCESLKRERDLADMYSRMATLSAVEKELEKEKADHADTQRQWNEALDSGLKLVKERDALRDTLYKVRAAIGATPSGEPQHLLRPAFEKWCRQIDAALA